MSGVHSISVSSKPVGRSQGHATRPAAKLKSIQKAIKIYTDLLKLDLLMFTVPWTSCEGKTRCVIQKPYNTSCQAVQLP